jgi:hypothetical protein
MSKDAQLSTTDKSIIEKAQTAVVDFLQVVTGVAMSDKKDLVRDVSHIVQRGVQWHLATGFVEEYNALKLRGAIQEDYDKTDQCRQQSSYLFEAINSDGAIDEKRFNAMKNIFLNGAKENMSDRNDMLPIIMMRLCSTLSEGELLVLEAASRLNLETMQSTNKTPRYEPNSSTSWLELIAKESGLGLADLVEHYEQSLLEKGLLNKRKAGGNIVVDTNYHLSGTGIKLCQFIKEYEPAQTELTVPNQAMHNPTR